MHAILKNITRINNNSIHEVFNATGNCGSKSSPGPDCTTELILERSCYAIPKLAKFSIP